MRDKTFQANIFSEDFHEIITLCEYTSVMLCIFGCTNLENVRVKIELLIVENFSNIIMVKRREIFYTRIYQQSKFSTFNIRKTFSIVYKSCFWYRYIIGFSVTRRFVGDF